MASLVDVPRAIRACGLFKFGLTLWKKINQDQIFMLSSALAYAWLFAIFPFLIFLLSLAPHLPRASWEKARHTIHHFIDDSMPRQGAETLNRNVDEVMDNRRPALLSVGLIVTIFSSSSGIYMTMYALDNCYQVKRRRPYFLQRGIAALITLAVTVLVLVVFILLPVTTLLMRWLWKRGDSTALMWTINLTRIPLAIVLMFTVLWTVYFFGPSRRPHVKFFSPGAVFTIAVWLGLEYTFRLFINQFWKTDQTYGAVGGVAVLLVMFYVDAAVLLIGAELNAAIDHVVGHQSGAAAPASSVAKSDPIAACEPPDWAPAK